jgi:hypothetical protein
VLQLFVEFRAKRCNLVARLSARFLPQKHLLAGISDMNCQEQNAANLFIQRATLVLPQYFVMTFASVSYI